MSVRPARQRRFLLLAAVIVGAVAVAVWQSELPESSRQATGAIDLGRTIRAFMDDGADEEWSRVVSSAERQELRALYAPADFGSLWFGEDLRLVPEAHAAISLISQAEGHGLDPRDYLLERLRELSAAVAQSSPAAPGDAARLDVELSLALLRFYRHLHFGRVDPRTLDFGIDAPAHPHDFVEMVRSARRESRILETATTLESPLAQYGSLRDALRRYRLLAGSWGGEAIAATAAVHPGDPYDQLAVLRRLLTAVGDLEATAPDSASERIYAEPVVSAVARFQRRHGLEPDGVIGPSTQAALAVPLSWRVRQIELALERLRWLPEIDRSPLIAVNIPMYRLWAWRAGTTEPSLSMNVVVGRAADTSTPVLLAEMAYIVFRPYWNVPVSIARGELLPAFARDPERMARDHFEIAGGGDTSPAVPVTEEALARVRRGSLGLRQRPGPGNALGLVKFVFPNTHDVYMHDTPAPALFGRSRRDFSHGCIRVEDPVGLAEWALADPVMWPRDKVRAALEGTDNRRVFLPGPVNVLLFYLTAAVMPEDGSIHFAEDIYGHDARLHRVLPAGARP